MLPPPVRKAPCPPTHQSTSPQVRPFLETSRTLVQSTPLVRGGPAIRAEGRPGRRTDHGRPATSSAMLLIRPCRYASASRAASSSAAVSRCLQGGLAPRLALKRRCGPLCDPRGSRPAHQPLQQYGVEVSLHGLVQAIRHVLRDLPMGHPGQLGQLVGVRDIGGAGHHVAGCV